MSSPAAASAHEVLELEYDQANQNFRHLAEIRFKLLALLPPFGGIAVFALSLAGINATAAHRPEADAVLALVAAIAAAGFLATFGVAVYDQRNSELYNALIHRLKELERGFAVPPSVGTLRREARWGGQFEERAPRGRTLFGFPISHDGALALIYGVVLGSWAFPFVYSLARLVGVPDSTALTAAIALALIAILSCVKKISTLDDAERERWNAAGQAGGREIAA